MIEIRKHLVLTDEISNAFAYVEKEIKVKQNEAGNQTEFCDPRNSSRYWAINGLDIAKPQPEQTTIPEQPTQQPKIETNQSEPAINLDR